MTPSMTPCWHTKALLAARADERLSGLALRYLEMHLARCGQCRAALASLLALRERLLVLRNTPSQRLSPTREAQVTAAFEKLVERYGKPPSQ